MKAWAIAIAVMAMATAIAAEQTRDSAVPPRPGAASVTGLVADERSQPVTRAIVLLVADTGSRATLVTDVDGRFAFGGLAAGRYTLSASKAAYVSTQYGATRPGRPGTSLVIAERAAITDANLTLVHGSVITGRVLDPSGEPSANTAVQAVPLRYGPGGRIAGPGQPRAATTDDRGVYRMFGLAPGDYLVFAMPRVDTEVRLVTQEDLDRADRELQQRAAASSGAGRGGMLPAAPAPPSATAPGPFVGYARVYYPGTIVPGAASPITLGPAEERTGVDLQIQLVRAARIEGTVTSMEGPLPAGLGVFLIPNSSAPSPSGTVSTQVQIADGRFSFPSVMPGDYAIAASAGQGVFTSTGNATLRTMSLGVGAGRGAAGAAPLFALASLSVDGRDQSGLSLTLDRGARVAGRVVFDGASLPPDITTTRIAVLPSADVLQVVKSMQAAVTLDSAGRFAMTGLSAGKYVVSAILPQAAGAPSPWSVKAVTLGGRDVTDSGFEIAPGGTVSEVVVTLTDRASDLSGAFQDASGRPTSDYWVILFPTDRARWTWQSRRVLATRPASDGRFTFRGFPPGEYFLTALTDVDQNEWFDPALLEQLLPASLRLTIAEGEKKVQDIRTK